MDQLLENENVSAMKLAEEIIELDLKRDALFEELISRLGNKAHELLRKVQNGY